MKNLLTIKNIMTLSPITKLSEDRVNSVIKTIKNNEFDHLPEVDRNNLLSKTDL